MKAGDIEQFNSPAFILLPTSKLVPAVQQNASISEHLFYFLPFIFLPVIELPLELTRFRLIQTAIPESISKVNHQPNR